MPQATDTALEIANKALLLCGSSKITSFTENVAQAVIVNDLYEDIAEMCLTEMRWRFCSKLETLTREAVAPPSKFDAYYTIPGDALLISNVEINDVDITYDIFGDAIACNASATDTVVCEYIFRAPESMWPSYFRQLVSLRLAADAAVPLTRDETLSNLLQRRADQQKVMASLYESQQKTTKKLSLNRFAAIRRS